MPARRSQHPLFATALSRLVLSAALVGLGACDGSDSPTAPQAESEAALAVGGGHSAGRIVFTGSTGSIYTMSADGSNVIHVLGGLDEPGGPVLSPDGTTIAFTDWTYVPSQGKTIQHLFVVDANGGVATDKLPNYSSDMAFPAWSADGTRLLFAGSDGSSDGVLAGTTSYPSSDSWSLRYNGLDVRASDLSFSADGQKAVFTRRGADAGVYVGAVADVGGNWVFTSLTKVYGAAGVAYRHPVLSPDGRKIVFASEIDDASGEIYVMNADGTGLRRLTTSPGMDGNPSWSPDGRRIAFASYRGGQLAVWSMTASGAKPRRLTDLNLSAGQPSYSR
jgi:Tol biopolymer transport system component